jgi:hypothetical protein
MFVIGLSKQRTYIKVSWNKDLRLFDCFLWFADMFSLVDRAPLGKSQNFKERLLLRATDLPASGGGHTLRCRDLKTFSQGTELVSVMVNTTQL